MPKFRFSIIHSAHDFSFADFLHHNSPKSKALYSFFGVFCFISTISTIYLTQYELLGTRGKLILYLYQMMLIISLFFSLYMMWPHSIRHPLVVGALWYVALIYNMTFCTTFFLLMSKFHNIQLIVCGLSLLMIFELCNWKTALTVIAVGGSGAFLFYKNLMGALPSNALIDNNVHLLIYIALFASTLLIFFLKPNKEFIEQGETKSDMIQDEIILLSAQIDHKRHRVETFNEEIKFLNNKIDFDTECVTDWMQEIERLNTTSQKILNHIVHELRLPVGNVMNFKEILSNGLEKMDKELLKELSDEIINNPKHLSTMTLNMLDLAALDIKKVKLNKKTMNLGELVTERVKKCHKLYLDNKEIDIKLTIQPEVLIPVDPHYMRQIVDNLVINAIKFSDKGLIKIQVTRNIDSAILIVKDARKVIPPDELCAFFKSFKTGHSKSEGRDVGLSFCRAAIKAHGGKIDVQGSGIGATFTVILPIKTLD